MIIYYICVQARVIYKEVFDILKVPGIYAQNQVILDSIVKDYARREKVLGPTKNKLLGNVTYYGISIDNRGKVLISTTR